MLSSGEEAVGVGTGTAAGRGARLRAGGFWVLCAVLAAVAALLLLGPLASSGGNAAGSRWLPWWLLLPAFTAAELVVVHVQLRRESLSVSFAEVPLVLGLAFCSPSALVAASIVGSGVGLLVRRQRGTKLLFNLCLFSVDTTLAATCYRWLLGSAGVGDVRGLLAALVAVVVCDLASATALTAVIWLKVGELDGEVLREAVTSGLVMALANTCVGLLFVVVVEAHVVAVLLLVAVVVPLVLGYRGYTAAHRALRRLEALHQFTRRVGRAELPADVRLAVLQESRDILTAEVAELVVLSGSGSSPDGWVHHRLQGDAVTHPDGPDATWWAPAAQGQPVLLTRAQAEGTGVRDGLASPVEANGSVVAVLLVSDRLQHLEPFDDADLRLFSSLTDQAGIALHNAGLLDRLRVEAAAQEHRSLHDGLTGLPNRRHVIRVLDAAMDAGSEAVAVCVLDLHGFTQVNHALGHGTGDELLVEVARRLRELAPRAGHVGRLGNDEFAVVLTGVLDEQDARDRAARCGDVLQPPFLLDGASLQVRASVGAALALADQRDGTRLLQHADAAMHEAKQGHRDAVVWDRAAADASTRRHLLVSALREAIAAGDLDVHYQPQVDPDTRAVTGAEALVRWTHPDLGPQRPDEFIVLAEHAGLLPALTDLVLGRATRECARWWAAGSACGVAVNLSARDLDDERIVGSVRAALAAAGLPPSALTLEVTETAVMADRETATSVLHRLRALGVHVSIDDFGTGQSSLAYLQQLPASEVKIDRSLVQGVLADAGTAVIVRAAIDLSHALGLTVVAEGVEDEATMTALAGWGCESVQGFLVSRPVPATAFRAWLAAPADHGVAALQG